MRAVMLGMAAILLIGAAPQGYDVNSAAGKAVNAPLQRAYGEYQRANGPREDDWDRPVFSVETRRLIRAWRKHIGGELTGLSSFGWFCDCQDLVAERFRWERAGLIELAPGRLEVQVKVDVGFGDFAEHRLILLREGRRWVIDDLFLPEQPDGLKAALRKELAQPPGNQE